MRVFVDTCVIVDALQDRKPFSENAKTIFYAVANKQIDGYVSAKSITDYEDAVMCETAERSEVDCIVTRNEKDYKKSKVNVLSPNELVNILENTDEN